MFFIVSRRFEYCGKLDRSEGYMTDTTDETKAVHPPEAAETDAAVILKDSLSGVYESEQDHSE